MQWKHVNFVQVPQISYETELLIFINCVPACGFETFFARPEGRESSLRYEKMLSLSHGELIKHYTGVDNPLSPLLISLVAPCRILQTISKLIPSTASPQRERESIAWKTHYQSSSTHICPWTHFPNLQTPLVTLNHLRLGEPPVFPTLLRPYRSKWYHLSNPFLKESQISSKVGETCSTCFRWSCLTCNVTVERLLSLSRWQ